MLSSFTLFIIGVCLWMCASSTILKIYSKTEDVIKCSIDSDNIFWCNGIISEVEERRDRLHIGVLPNHSMIRFPKRIDKLALNNISLDTSNSNILNNEDFYVGLHGHSKLNVSTTHFKRIYAELNDFSKLETLNSFSAKLCVNDSSHIIIGSVHEIQAQKCLIPLESNPVSLLTEIKNDLYSLNLEHA